MELPHPGRFLTLAYIPPLDSRETANGLGDFYRQGYTTWTRAGAALNMDTACYANGLAPGTDAYVYSTIRWGKYG